MLITDQKTLEKRIRALTACDFITIDTEFLREKTYFSKLCLIQVSGPDKEAFAIDPLDGDLNLKPLFDLLLNEKVLKIFHAARADMEILYNIMNGKLPTPIFDTQIAAMVCGYGDQVGYENLVRNITGNALDKSVQYTNWAHRPLSERQIDYALGDVTYLVDLYEHLSKQLEKQRRTAWVYEEEAVLTDPKTYAIDPQESWKRVKIKSPKPKNLAVLRALAAWREEEAQKRDHPKNWVLRDETLADMAGQIPKDSKALKKIRNIPADAHKSKLGEKLLTIIKDALESDQTTWPQVKKKKPLPSKAAAKLELLKTFLRIQAAEHDVAAKLIGSSDDLEALALGQDEENKLLQGWRYEIFGREAQELRSGHLAIGLKGPKIVKFKINDDKVAA